MQEFSVFDAKDASQFFNKFFDGSYSHEFHVFRGQANSTWGLTSGVARLNYDFVNREMTESGLDGDYINYRALEYYFLRCFIQGCDKSGINIPEDSSVLRGEYALSNNVGEIPFVVNFLDDHSLPEPPSNWPKRRDYALIAMAQHHGLPTRLLDWSSSPYVAMYVASVEGMRKLIGNISADIREDSDEKVAVWALNAEQLNKTGMSAFKLIKTPPYASQNIIPQESYFTTFESQGYGGDAYEVDKDKGACRCLMKMTLPLKDSLSLFKSCLQKGFTGANMYPGPEGAALHAKEMALVRELEHYGYF